MSLTPAQALDCFASDDLIGLGMEADSIRRRLHPEGVATYVIEPQIELTTDTMVSDGRIRSAVEQGATGIVVLVPNPDLKPLAARLTALRSHFPSLGLSLNPVCIQAVASAGLGDALAHLVDCGLTSVTADRADLSTADWLDIHRAAHQLGLRTTASLTFGAGESASERVGQLEALRQTQLETGGFSAFRPIAYRATGNGWDEPTATEYLKTLAICRMYLDTVENVQGNGPLKVLQMTLRFGGNDLGSAVLAAKADTQAATEEELRRVIRDAGFRPAQRDGRFRTWMLN